ncbi:MAG: dienelactone hydrolase family protein [Gammaproteobacteria bacterium]|nr:dienelactone hydrolase family protein [Gammaproteobacteria bacterium]
MTRFIAFIFASLISLSATAEIQTQEIEYLVGSTKFTGYFAYDDAIKHKRPGILIVHEWWGHNNYARMRTKMLAEAGYTAFALDMYGSGKQADHPDDAKKFMQAVISNMDEARKRFNTAHQILKDHSTVDSEKTAAMGYCFGGGVVLNMARAGADLDAVVSYHGSLGTKTPAKPGEVKAKVRVFNGAADPFVTQEQIDAIKKEMKQAGVDFKLTNYPDAKHSFTNPDADKFGERFKMPLAYDKQADIDSWQQTLTFFRNLFK